MLAGTESRVCVGMCPLNINMYVIEIPTLRALLYRVKTFVDANRNAPEKSSNMI